MRRPATELPTAHRAGADWAVVVPAKSLDRAKSRMTPELSDSARRELVRAMLLDVLAATRRSPVVAVVAVVTADPELARLASDAGARVLAEFDDPDPDAAVVSGGDHTFRFAAAVGLSWARTRHSRVAVLASDLPGLATAELTAALEAAREVDRGFVPDADGDGTTLATFAAADSAPQDLRTFFGADSAAEFARSGARELSGDSGWTGLRRDVDSVGHLERLSDLGEHSRDVVDSWLADVPGTHSDVPLGKLKE